MSECENPACGFHSLLRGSNEPMDRYVARMRAVFQNAERPYHRAGGRPRADLSRVLAALSADRWTTSHEVAAATGVSRTAARIALTRAIARGAPIQSHRRGYRLKEAGA